MGLLEYIIINIIILGGLVIVWLMTSRKLPQGVIEEDEEENQN